MKAKKLLSKTLLHFLATLFLSSWSIFGHNCDIDANSIILFGTYLSGFNFWSLKVSDIGTCARACIRMTLCLSFNFDLQDGTCELNSGLLENWSGSEIKKLSRVYSSKKDWPREVSVMSFKKSDSGTHATLLCNKQVCKFIDSLRQSLTRFVLHRSCSNRTPLFDGKILGFCAAVFMCRVQNCNIALQYQFRKAIEMSKTKFSTCSFSLRY